MLTGIQLITWPKISDYFQSYAYSAHRGKIWGKLGGFEREKLKKDPEFGHQAPKSRLLQQPTLESI
jgi:hypothetical protein